LNGCGAAPADYGQADVLRTQVSQHCLGLRGESWGRYRVGILAIRFNECTFEMEDHGFDVHCLVLHTKITNYSLLLLGSRIPGKVIEIMLLIEIVLVDDIIELDLHNVYRLFKQKKQ
jgi:hypothetical protein